MAGSIMALQGHAVGKMFQPPRSWEGAALIDRRPTRVAQSMAWRSTLTPTSLSCSQGLVLGDEPKEVGVNVDLAAMGWATPVGRRSVKGAPSPERRGWHTFPPGSP